MTGEAVKVTDVPAQSVVCEAEILTVGALMELTVTMILLLNKTAGVAQTAFEVNTQYMVSLFDKLLLV